MTPSRILVPLLASAVMLIAAASSAQEHAAAPTATGPTPYFDDLGPWHRAITTREPQAQKFFDQGLRLLYAFNLEEAQRSFEEAARLDSTCALCEWGVAMSLGPHVNLPALPERTVAAAHHAKKALALKNGASPVEQALIDAIQPRYSDPAPTNPDDQKRLDQGYADAMRGVLRRYAGDPDVQALTVEAMMNTRPWDYWQKDGSPQPGMEDAQPMLEKLLAQHPDHPAASHLYIHIMEASRHPERAVAAAKRLETAMPGQGHMVHMPSHIYKRIGRYEDSAEWNRRAIRVDDEYRKRVNPQGFYLMYVAHNHQFLMASCWMLGRYEEAIEQARATLDVVPVDMLRQMPGFDLVLGYPVWTQVRFGRWNDVLAEPTPPPDFVYAQGVWRAARGLALAALGRVDEAVAERDTMQELRKVVPPGTPEGLNDAQALLGIAWDMLSGAIEAKRGNVDQGVKHLRAAAAAEDDLRYNEPSDWYVPVRHLLGAVLLDAGRAAEAQAVFEEDLQHNPENPWALSGLAKSLRAQKKAKAAAAAEARAAKAAKTGDVRVVASWM